MTISSDKLFSWPVICQVTSERDRPLSKNYCKPWLLEQNAVGIVCVQTLPPPPLPLKWNVFCILAIFLGLTEMARTFNYPFKDQNEFHVLTTIFQAASGQQLLSTRLPGLLPCWFLSPFCWLCWSYLYFTLGIKELNILVRSNRTFYHYKENFRMEFCSLFKDCSLRHRRK